MWIRTTVEMPKEYMKDYVPPREYWVLVDAWWTKSKCTKPAFFKKGHWYDGNFNKINPTVRHWTKMIERPINLRR